MNKSLFVNADVLTSELGISRPFAYKLLAQWNSALEKAGYCVIHGRVPRAYYEKKFYGFDSRGKEVV
ncbi:MAG: DNA-binding protein [Clostridiales bacterium]|nr:DNA-binding protein [Clostridiales bacterium]